MTKNQKKSVLLLGMSMGLLSVSACSTLRGGTSSEEIAAQGPTVLEARTNPRTFELNANLQPTSQAEILAEVKDFNSRVSDVRLRFIHVPLEVPMEHVGGSTWRARLTPAQLRTLAVGGQTMNYQANVIAKNAEGLMAVSKDPVKVAVTAPDLATQQG